MLSRVADAIYWMSRYLERAENIARLIEVNWYMTLEHHPDQEFQQWQPLVSITGDEAKFSERYEEVNKANVITFLTLDKDYPHSIISCVQAARENARTIREIIPSELWEQINTFYHAVHDLSKRPKTLQNNPYDFCKDVKLRGMLLGGITNDTMDHTEGWHFYRVGRHLERADKTSRILDVKYFILLPNVDYVGTAYDDIQWAALLRTTDSLSAYRQRYGRIRPANVVEFLMLRRKFPRSILHCLIEAEHSLHSVSGSPLGTFGNRAEQVLGHLCARLTHATTDSIFEQGLHEFTDQLQIEMNNVDIAIAETFFGASLSAQSQQQ
ncbi:MAG: alpha-E domain-containing protein [Anaerolineae bacterium]|nr:alpha-E domain-containing protein [Anaerolineae bacterium]